MGYMKQELVSGAWDGVFDPADGPLCFASGYGGSGTPSQAIAKSDVLPDPANPLRANFELMHDGSMGYILHLTQGPNCTGSAALIGLGVDAGGDGLFVNNKVSGVGIRITQAGTISSETAYGMVVSQSSQAPGIYGIQQVASSVAPVIVLDAADGMSVNSKLLSIKSAGVETIYVQSATGQLNLSNRLPYISPINVNAASGTTAHLQDWSIAGTNLAYIDNLGLLQCTNQRIVGASATIQIYNTTGVAGARRFHLLTGGGMFSVRAADDSGGKIADMLFIGQSGNMALGNTGGSAAWGDGVGAMLVMPNVTNPPSYLGANMGCLYVQGGVLKFRGGSGTVTTVAPA